MGDPFSAYQQHGRAEADALRDSLSSDDVAALRDALRQTDLPTWVEWERENRAAITLFLQSTPAQRMRRKVWADADVQRWLRFAAYRQACLAVAVLDAHTQLYPGGSYRAQLASAFDLGCQIVQATGWTWPFDPPDPFRSV